MDYENFGQRLSWTGFVEDTVKAIAAKSANNIEKAQKIYAHIQNHMKWNNKKRLYTSQSLKDAYKNASGNSAEINLLLVAMLQKAGFTADPVILSTRDNGMVIVENPVLDKFNYVVCGVTIDGKFYTLDATDKYCPFGVMPYRCLNGKGRLINEITSRNIDFSPAFAKSTVTSVNAKIIADGEMEASIQTIYRGYAAINFRNDFSESKSADEFIKDLQDSHTGLTISKYNIKGIDSITGPVNIDLSEVTIANKCDVSGNIISVNPMLYEQLKENPFKLENRKYPVDYGYNIDESYIISLQIPEGYEIDELPKPFSMSLPENGGKFTYNCAVNGSNVQVIRKFQINRALFTEATYTVLKEFYAKMVEKEAGLIVFKKSGISAQL